MKKKLFRWLFMLMCIFATSLTLSSCSKDDGKEEEVKPYSTYSIEFTLVDKGDWTTLEVSEVILELNNEWTPKDWSVDEYNKALLIYEQYIAEYKRNLTCKRRIVVSCDLIRDHSKTVKSTKLEITPSGTYEK